MRIPSGAVFTPKRSLITVRMVTLANSRPDEPYNGISGATNCRVRILVVDDTLIVLQTTEMMLRKAGYQVTPASSGVEALRIVQEQDFDLVLLDVVMGHVSGPEAARGIRLMQPGIPIVFMTGFTEHFDMLDAQREILIRKPFTSDTLTKTLGRMLSKHATGAAG